MAIKTFTAGSVLTAADTNTYLANSGLVYVKSQTVGSGVTSVTVTGAFSATYDNYQIVWTGGTMSNDTSIKLQLGSTTTGYYGSLIYGSYAGGAPLNANNNNFSSFEYACGGTPNVANIDLYLPFASDSTQIDCRVRFSTVYGKYVGILANSTSYTDFTFIASAGTITGGTITVYGYRKA